MRSRLTRAQGLVQRYRVDRRLPPSVLQLYTDVGRLRRREAAQRRAAHTRAVLGGEHDGQVVVRQGGRRVSAAGILDVSLNDLAHRFASEVLAALHDASIDTFLVDRDGDGLTFGLALADRSRALEALAAHLAPSWYLGWEDGSRAGTTSIVDAAGSRRVRRARSWALYEPRAWGGLATGQEQAVRLTFWHTGTSGLTELVGTRGQARFDPRSATTTEVIDGHEYPGRSAFPVGRGLERMIDPIDIVYTWVDGADPAWQDAFRSTAREFGRDVSETALDPARYHSRDELRYSLRSVWAFCGWARHIFVVTAGQRPEWLVEDDRVRIVDHSEILPADALPTFNSHAMESALHRIDGLAERFVYFNDDMLVGHSLRPETFFTPNGLPRVFQSDARVPAVESDDMLAVDTAARRGRELLDERFGRVVAHKPLHSPYPLLRSVMADIAAEFPDIVEATSRSRFRSPSDLSIAASFAQHYALATGRAVLGDIRSDYVHVESGRLRWHLDRLLLGQGFDTFCINETAQDPAGMEAREARIREFFEAYFPVAAPWENDRNVVP